MILHDIIEDGAVRHGDKSAIIFKGEELTYRQLKEEAEKIASSLISLGIKEIMLLYGCRTIFIIYLFISA